MVAFDHGFGFFGVAGWIWMIVMFLFWIVMIALVIWGVSALISSSRQPSRPYRPDEDNAMRILRERFARGEIDTEQYEQARRTLQGDQRSSA